jgi:hypothetical protein
MTPFETRIRDALRTSAELPVSPEDLGQAEARFRSRQELPSRRPRVAPVFPAVALAVAAALVVAAGLAWWLVRPGTGDDIQPAPPAPRPTEASPGPDARVGYVGLPEEGAVPTGPASGRLVANAGGWNNPTWVFADGRLITLERYGTNDTVGFLVRQLTGSGVDAMRAYLVDGTAKLTPPEQIESGGPSVRVGGRMMIAQAFEDCDSLSCPRFEQPETWLPASAWADPTFRPFVPHAYELIVRVPSTTSPANVLPAEVADILPTTPDGVGEYRQVVPLSAAHELADIMDGAGFVRREDPGGLAYEVSDQGEFGGLSLQAVLPTGGSFCFDCG